MTDQDNDNGEALRQNLEAYTALRHQWINESIEIIAGDRHSLPADVLPRPTQQQGEARADSPDLGLSEEQEQTLREIAGRFGIGGEQDVMLDDSGLSEGHVAVLEGGKVWKIVAELALTAREGTLVFSGTPYREPDSQEREFARTQLQLADDQIGTTEYDLARNVAESMAGFEPLEEDEVLPFGYDIHNNHALVQEPTGQLIKIGTVNDKPVLLLRIDRQPLEDGRYEKQPDTAAVLGFMADILNAVGDNETTVGMITSNMYASRMLDAIRAGLEKGRQFGIGMYGRETLAMVKDEPVAEPAAINQIPSELRVMYDKLLQLEESLRSNQA